MLEEKIKLCNEGEGGDKVTDDGGKIPKSEETDRKKQKEKKISRLIEEKIKLHSEGEGGGKRTNEGGKIPKAEEPSEDVRHETESESLKIIEMHVDLSHGEQKSKSETDTARHRERIESNSLKRNNSRNSVQEVKWGEEGGFSKHCRKKVTESEMKVDKINVVGEKSRGPENKLENDKKREKFEECLRGSKFA